MADDNNRDLILMLNSFRDDLRMDKAEFDHALREFLCTRRPLTQEHVEPWQSPSENTDDASPKMMLDRRQNANNRQFPSRGQQPVEEVPKYGLPGMGQYEEKQRKYKEQLKDEYRNYMREQNATNTRRRLRDDHEDSVLNYDELLARKREEERNYRNRNEGFSNGGMRANSDGYLNRMPKPEYNYGPLADIRPEVEEVTNVMSRIQRYNDELSMRDDEDVRYSYGAYAGAPERPHSYPHDAHLPPNFQHNGYNTEQDGHRGSESPKFITLDPPPPRASNDHSGEPNAYLNDLDSQVEESRRRRQNEREERLRYEQKLEEDNKAYDPWGRGGAGAPMRDRDGNVIASRKQMGNGGERKSHANHRLAPSSFTDANNRKKSDAQDTVHNYAIPRSPLPGQSSKYQGRKTNHDTYQEDLKRQIEEKKLRNKEEKERERLEEERLMRRIEEENEKMTRDHEEELQKQRLREDERRRRNEELQRRQEEQRKAAEMQKRDKKLRRRQEHFEERGVTLARQTSKSEDAGIRSPPLPGRKSKMATAATNKPTIAAKSATGILVPANKQESSKDHILSQLSVMRQQLEKEQQLMQKQLKREMGSGYEVFDKKAIETRNERNLVTSDERNKPSIYRPSTPPPQPKPPVKKIPSAVKYNLPVYKDFVDDVQATVPAETKTAIAPVAKSRTLWPAMAMAIRATDGLKPLQGESLFLGVDGYETSGPETGIHRRNANWQPDALGHHETSDEYQFDIDQLASHNAARRRYLSTLKDDPDEIKEDSFLDEFLAKNLQR